MTRSAAIGLVAGAVLLAASSVLADGKKAAFASDSNVTLNNGFAGDGVILSTVIAKGKKKHALAIDCETSLSAGCPLAGSWWIDLDEAEAASPGTFIGQPLTVHLLGGANTVVPPTNPTASATMTVRLVTK